MTQKAIDKRGGHFNVVITFDEAEHPRLQKSNAILGQMLASVNASSGITGDFDESKHPRAPEGTHTGGQFVSKNDFPKQHTYVARYTDTPLEDVKRNWSAHMGERGNLWSAADTALAQHGIDTNDYDTEEEILEELEKIGLEFRQYPDTEMWGQFHHEGLSCWPLEAKNAEDAVTEAKKLATTNKILWGGFGSATTGKVEYVKPVSGIDDLHIFKCEGHETED